MRVLAGLAVLALFASPADAVELDSVIKDIAGVWQLDFTTPDYERMTPIVIVGRQHDKLFALRVGEDEKMEAFKEVRLVDDVLLLTIVPKEQGGSITVTFEAKLGDENRCHGEAKYTSDDGDSGTWDFTGKRFTASDFDEAEQFKISFTTPDYEDHEAVVTVVANGEKLYGWYSSKEYEVPAKKVTLEGDKVTMSMTVKTEDGSNIDVTFRGKLDGDEVEGEAEYDFEGDTGTFEFEGKRKS